MNYSSINIEKVYPRTELIICRAVYDMLSDGDYENLCLPRCTATNEAIVARYFYEECIPLSELLPMCKTTTALVKILKSVKSTLFYYNEEYGIEAGNFLLSPEEIFMSAESKIFLLPSIVYTATPENFERDMFLKLLELSDVEQSRLERLRLAIDSYYSIDGLKLESFKSALDMALEAELDEISEHEIPLASIEAELVFDTASRNMCRSIPDLPVIENDAYSFESDFGNLTDFGSLTFSSDTYTDVYNSCFVADYAFGAQQGEGGFENWHQEQGEYQTSRAMLVDENTNDAYPIYTMPFSIGSASENAMVIEKAGICGHHATIFVQDGEYYIQSENSSSSIYINGKATSSGNAYHLNSGCVIALGGESFIFQLGY